MYSILLYNHTTASAYFLLIVENIDSLNMPCAGQPLSDETGLFNEGVMVELLVRLPVKTVAWLSFLN